MADLTPADKLEAHLAREFVSDYIERAIGNRLAVQVDPHRIYMAARFSGLKVSTNTLNKVIQEMLT